jgi:hypothetical protein
LNDKLAGLVSSTRSKAPLVGLFNLHLLLQKTKSQLKDKKPQLLQTKSCFCSSKKKPTTSFPTFIYFWAKKLPTCH